MPSGAPLDAGQDAIADLLGPSQARLRRQLAEHYSRQDWADLVLQLRSVMGEGIQVTNLRGHGHVGQRGILERLGLPLGRLEEVPQRRIALQDLQALELR